MRIIRLTLVLAFGLGLLGVCLAQEVEQSPYCEDCQASLPVTATFPVYVSFEHRIRWADGGDENTEPATPFEQGRSGDVDNDILDFGKLEYNDTYNISMAEKYFTVFFDVEFSAVKPYMITQRCDGFVNEEDPARNLNKSLVMTPHYVEAELWDPNGNPDDPWNQQGPLYPGEGPCASALAVGPERVIAYSISSPRIWRCYYGIANNDPDAEIPEPADAVPPDGNTRGGTYSGTIIFTLLPSEYFGP